MKIRITLEYDTDGQTLDQEQQDWIEGNVAFIDLWTLHQDSDAAEDIIIRFEAV